MKTTKWLLATLLVGYCAALVWICVLAKQRHAQSPPPKHVAVWSEWTPPPTGEITNHMVMSLQTRHCTVCKFVQGRFIGVDMKPSKNSHVIQFDNNHDDPFNLGIETNSMSNAFRVISFDGQNDYETNP